MGWGGGETRGKMGANEWVGEEERHRERWEIMSGLGRRRDTGKMRDNEWVGEERHRERWEIMSGLGRRETGKDER